MENCRGKYWEEGGWSSLRQYGKWNVNFFDNKKRGKMNKNGVWNPNFVIIKCYKIFHFQDGGRCRPFLLRYRLFILCFGLKRQHFGFDDKWVGKLHPTTLQFNFFIYLLLYLTRWITQIRERTLTLIFSRLFMKNSIKVLNHG